MFGGTTPRRNVTRAVWEALPFVEPGDGKDA